MKSVKKEVKHRYKGRKFFGMKKKSWKSKGLSKAARRKVDKHQMELAQKRAKAVDHMVRQVTAASGVPRSNLFSLRHEEQANKTHGFEVSLISQKKKQRIAAKASVNSFMVEVTSGQEKERNSIENGKNKASKKKCFDVSLIDLKPKEGSENICVKKNDNVGIGAMIEKQTKRKNTCDTKGNKKLFKSEDSEQMGADIIVDLQNVQPSSDKAAQGTKAKSIKESDSSKRNVSMTISETMKLRLQNTSPPKANSVWDEPLHNREYEIFIKSRRHINKSKKKKINPIKVSYA